MGKLADHIKQVVEKKKISADQWLSTIAENASKCVWATHIGKFTNPDAKVVLHDLEKDAEAEDGYLTTASTQPAADMSVNAAYLGTAKLLMLEQENGRSVFENLKSNRTLVLDELKQLTPNAEELVAKLLLVEEGHQPEDSDDRLRQVYFPVGKNEYHLLTVLPPSSLMLKLSAEVSDMEEMWWKVRDTKSEHYKQEYRQIFGILPISFGGTKPQNISAGNNSVGGRLWMLPSQPPCLSPRDVRVPKKNFFAETLWARDFSFLFQELHKIYETDWNNVNIRRRRSNLEASIIDQIMSRAYQLRQLASGWSDAENVGISRAQKIWLDQKYADERNSESDWQEEISRAMADWVLHAYERLLKDQKILLGNEEQREIRLHAAEIIAETLAEEGR